MPPEITIEDLNHVVDLSSREYIGNKISSATTEEEYTKLKDIKNKLEQIAKFFQNKYSKTHGPFKLAYPTGNPINVGGKKLKGIWCGIFKGAENKQYAAQISLVTNQKKPILDIGFYFGEASGRNLSKSQNKEHKSNLNKLGGLLVNDIQNEPVLKEKYNLLFDCGFIANVQGYRVEPLGWLESVKTNAKSSGIKISISPNREGVIETKTLDLFVSMLIDFMIPIPSSVQDLISQKSITRIYNPLTPEQRAEQAKKRTIIGNIGEEKAMDFETERLNKLGFGNKGYPKHTSKNSKYHNYDILSLDEKNKEIFIEVKSTIRTQYDSFAKEFILSKNEFNFFQKNKERYRIYRIFDVENSYSVKIIDMKSIKIEPDSYKVSYL